MLVQKWNSSFGGYTLLISYANVRVSAMATTDLEGKYHELPGAHTRDQSDLVHIPALPITSCVTMDKLFRFSEPHFLLVIS